MINNYSMGAIFPLTVGSLTEQTVKKSTSLTYYIYSYMKLLKIVYFGCFWKIYVENDFNLYRIGLQKLTGRISFQILYLHIIFLNFQGKEYFNISF